jgi:ABC-2 type transport system permease protein
VTATLPAVRATPNDLGSRGSARRRVLALAAAETRLLLRNRTAVMSSVLLPLALVAAVGAITMSNGGTVDGPGLVASALGVTLTFVTFYNLVTTFVTRREELVLQRMRTGELTDAEVLLGRPCPRCW